MLNRSAKPGADTTIVDAPTLKCRSTVDRLHRPWRRARAVVHPTR